MANNEILLEKNNKFITKYGTLLSESKPTVIYLRTKSKITPLKEKPSFEEDIVSIKTQFNNYVKKTILQNKNIDNNYLFNVDISSKSVKWKKVSFLRYDIFLKPLKRKPLLDNKKLFEKISIKLDTKLDNLLNKYDIKCL